jgi:two-component system nitrogen regulation sensor histidine kinase NtrY
VANPGRTGTWERLNRMRKLRRVQNGATLGLVLLGPVLTAATFLILGPFDRGASSLSLRLVLLADLVYVLTVAALVLQRVAKMIAERRAKSAGSRLHLRLVGVFTAVALVPTVLVAIFGGLTVNVGLEGWFSDRVRTVLGTSLSAAVAYEEEHRRDLVADTQALADYLNAARQANFFVSDGELRQILTQGQALIQRGLREAYIIDGAGRIRSRGERSYLFDFEAPSAAQLDAARTGGVEMIEDWDQDEFRALVALGGYADRFLYVSRIVDGDILNLLDDTQETVGLYNQLESQRGRIVFEFALLYLGFALILILASVWLGLWFAERLSRPVGRLTGAAQRVGAGDLDVRVVEENGDDEIAMLGRIFNQMTKQLKGQREALVTNAEQIERRRRLFDSVLSSVTGGVIGLDADGRVAFVNRAGERILRLKPGVEGQALGPLVPEFAGLLARLSDDGSEVAQEEVRLTRAGKMENLLVRIARRRAESGELEGYVIAFDDVTDLVSAQRMAAWGDVARRIAHEIKNPLTPIQLSAERLKRKFSPMVGGEAEALEQMTGVIVRQTNDLRRIVDEFSKFARMPQPELRDHDLARLVREKVSLQETAFDGVLRVELPPGPILAEIDDTMIGQALVNLLKNAAEAIEARQEKGAAFTPEIRVSMTVAGTEALISIEENGIGLPEDRARLFEPYVTTRSKGTGLGLPIVKKIVEEHGGTLILTDAEPFGDDGQRGARAEMRLTVRGVAEAAAE